MKCQKCKKEFDEVLTLFDGSLVCPKCKSPIFDADFKITRENDEIFKLSELFYLNALKAESRKDYKKYIEQATSLCIYAANLGHPSAVWRIGFYYQKDYMERNRSESERLRYAGFYFKLLYKSKLESVSVEKGIDGYQNDFYLKLKTRAASDFLNIIGKLKAGNAETMRFEREYIKSVYGLTSSFDVIEDKTSGKPYDILKECSSDFRPPRFGMIKMTKAEFCESYSEICPLLASDKKISSVMIYFDDEWNARITTKPLSDIKNIEEYFKRWEEDKDAKGSKGTLFLFFVNRAGKNKMTSHLKKDFFEYLRISDGRASDTLQKFLGTFYVKCRSNGCDFVFTDDDIIAQNTRSADEALANIMNKI